MATKPNKPAPYNGAKNCLEDWETDLKEVQNKLKMAVQEKTGNSAKYSNASLWEGKLSMFWASIQYTEELTQDISGHLEIFLGQTDIVCNNIECSQMAIKYLFCKVRKIFECTDELKEKLSEFFMKVECLGDDSINVKSSFIIECLTNIMTKLDLAIAKQQELLKKMIDIMQCIDELKESICDDGCGVEGQLKDLMDIYKRSGEETITCDIEKSCDEEIEPKPVLPLNCDRVYVFTREQQNLAEHEKKTIKHALEEVCKEYETLSSCERSLKEAIDSSKAVQECK